ncbi:MAG: membrane protein insertion efficiency factor YidD [Clostridiales bacterium]|nr:membrane protein insertion efficiency factor YidD [Clostridiales bacterium]
MKRILIALIHFYQRHISSATAPSCRFTPTCSAYALEAIERFGAFRGTGLALWRLLRCQPLCRPGYDPVPEKKPRHSRHSCGQRQTPANDFDR